MANDEERRIRDTDLYRSLFHPGERFRQSEVFGSIVRHPRPDTPRGRAMTSFHNLFLHIYPVKVPREVLGWRATLRLGFISSVLFLTLFVSGTYLMFFYHPAVPQAYFDMHTCTPRIAFGQFIRNIHRWSAHLMVLDRVPPHDAGLLLGRVSRAPPVQLGRRRGAAVTDVALVVHRIPPAMGPARLLGDHGRNQYRGLRAAPRRPRAPDSCSGRPEVGEMRCFGSTCSTSTCCPA